MCVFCLSWRSVPWDHLISITFARSKAKVKIPLQSHVATRQSNQNNHQSSSTSSLVVLCWFGRKGNKKGFRYSATNPTGVFKGENCIKVETPRAANFRLVFHIAKAAIIVISLQYNFTGGISEGRIVPGTAKCAGDLAALLTCFHRCGYRMSLAPCDQPCHTRQKS